MREVELFAVSSRNQSPAVTEWSVGVPETISFHLAAYLGKTRTFLFVDFHILEMLGKLTHPCHGPACAARGKLGVRSGDCCLPGCSW